MRFAVLSLFFTSACASTQMNTPPPAANPIVQTGHAVLRERAQEVPSEKIKTPEIQDLIAKMIDTMRAAPGVGLAAPQIGVGLRIFVLEDREDYISKAAKIETTEKERVAFAPRVFINPVLTPVGEDRVTFFEGCLSVSGFAGLVERALEVEVTGLDEHGEPQTWRVRGWPARILQHEFDHIEGRLYIDRMRTRSFSTGEQVKERFGGKSISEILATPELQ